MSNIRTYEITHSEQKPLPIKQKDTTDYLLGGSLVMKNGKIDKVLFDGGYAQASVATKTTDKFAFNFYNQDHLGNNREVVDAKGVVQQVTNYYPFGAPYADATAVKGANLQPYKYNGKELDLMHGLNTYDYGARQHDPILGRWDRIDPLCEKYYSTSPYAYCLNNPVILVDPDGEDVHLSISNVPCDSKGPIKVLVPGGGASRMGIYVPLYTLTVTDDDSDKITNYYVTRDAPYSEDNGNTFTNYAFEPIDATGVYDGVIDNYPIGTDLKAIRLTNNGDRRIEADGNRPFPSGGEHGWATGIMIHVGGYYDKGDYLKNILKWFFLKGCDTMARLPQGVRKRKDGTLEKRITITVEKRENVEWQNNCINWPVTRW